MKFHSTVNPLRAVFFFGSYEGIRVLQPRIANTYVPSLASRQNASSAAHPLLDAFPKPTGADLGNGTVAFAAEYSEPSSLDTFSGRTGFSAHNWARTKTDGSGECLLLQLPMRCS